MLLASWFPAQQARRAAPNAPSVLRRPHIQCVAESVTEKVEREEREREQEGRKLQEPRILLHFFRPVLDQHPPRTHGWLYTKAEKTKECLEQHYRRNRERRINNDR